MKLYQYEFLNNGLLRLDMLEGESIWVSLDENSGRVLTREKVNSISRVQHTGIWLGKDHHNGTPYVLHNHYLYGKAHITTFKKYAANQRVDWKNGECSNGWDTVIEKGLDQVIAGKRYSALDYNCQNFTNKACHNVSRSEDVEKWGGIVVGGLLVFLLFSAVAESARAA